MANNWKDSYSRYREFFLNIARVYYGKPNFKIYLELVLSLITTIVFSIFAIKPTVITIIELNKEIKAKEETLVKIRQKLDNLQKANNNLQQNKEKIELLKIAVPNQANPEQLISYMENAAIKNEASILNLSGTDIVMRGPTKNRKRNSGQTKELPENANELSFITGVSGTYQSFKNLLTDFEKSTRPIKIDLISINSVNKGDTKSLILNINGRLPFLLEGEE